MLVPFFRTILLYLFIIVAFRLMGKRQVAEMQATEFVITILISAVASVPMQDLNIPLLHGIVPIVTLICAEIFLSVLSMHSIKLRKLLSGTPVPIIRNGVIDQTALRKVRMTLDDVFETLRLSQIFDLRKVEFAQVETNGQISFLLSPRHAGSPLHPAACAGPDGTFDLRWLPVPPESAAHRPRPAMAPADAAAQPGGFPA